MNREFFRAYLTKNPKEILNRSPSSFRSLVESFPFRIVSSQKYEQRVLIRSKRLFPLAYSNKKNYNEIFIAKPFTFFLARTRIWIESVFPSVLGQESKRNIQSKRFLFSKFGRIVSSFRKVSRIVSSLSQSLFEIRFEKRVYHTIFLLIQEFKSFASFSPKSLKHQKSFALIRKVAFSFPKVSSSKTQ